MDVAKTWQGGDYIADYTNWDNRQRTLGMENGMSADNFQDVEGKPDMVQCTVYLRCMTWEKVIVPRSGFEKPKLEKDGADKGLAQRARNALGRFVSAQ